MPSAIGPAPTNELGVSIADDLVVVSNRQPYRHRFEEEGDERHVVIDRPAGGLTAGLDPVLQQLGGTWVAWGDGDADRYVGDQEGIVEVPPGDPTYSLQHVYLNEGVVRGYYNGYANQTLWPLCHTMMENFRLCRDYWKRYRMANEQFAKATEPHASSDTIVWFQDYHLALAPKMLRDETDALFMHFWHVPWPSVNTFRVCPQRRILLEGLLANDLLGFHINRYCENFLECVDELVPEATVDYKRRLVYFGNAPTRVESFPLGIDVDVMKRCAAQGPDGGETFCRNHGVDPARRLVLGVDRLDYTKGIPERLAALEWLWGTTPELRGAFTYVQKASRSRSDVLAYQRLQKRVSRAVDRVNRRFETDDWQPVIMTDEYLSRERLCGLYRAADVMLVTPLCDGMNLVSHEYVAAQVDNDGALVLSQFAGAHEIFGEFAFTVDPRNVLDCAETIKRALSAGDNERRSRMLQLRDCGAEVDLNQWITSVLESGEAVRYDRELTSKTKDVV